MDKTIDSSSYIGQDAVGYMVNTGLDSANQQVIANLQHQLMAAFGEAIWCQPAATLHITLMDWLAPLVDYGEDKDKLCQQLLPGYDSALAATLGSIEPITINFGAIKVSPAAVFAVGQDNGQFIHIRKQFLERVDLLPGTKPPPSIIHFTIARFLAVTDLSPIQDFVDHHPFGFTQTVRYFRLVRETKLPMLDYGTLKQYHLQTNKSQPVDS